MLLDWRAIRYFNCTSGLPQCSGSRRSKNHIEIFGWLGAAFSSNCKCRFMGCAPAWSTFWANEGSCRRQSQNVLKLSPLRAQAASYGRPRAIASKRFVTRSGVFLDGRPPLLSLRTAPVYQRGSGHGNIGNRCENCRNLLQYRDVLKPAEARSGPARYPTRNWTGWPMCWR